MPAENILQQYRQLLNILAQKFPVVCNHIPTKLRHTPADILFRSGDMQPRIRLMQELQIIMAQDRADHTEIFLECRAADVQHIAKIITFDTCIVLKKYPDDLVDTGLCGLTSKCAIRFQRIQKTEEPGAIRHRQFHPVIGSCLKLCAVRQHHPIQLQNVIVDRPRGDTESLGEFLAGDALIFRHEKDELQPSIHKRILLSCHSCRAAQTRPSPTSL